VELRHTVDDGCDLRCGYGVVRNEQCCSIPIRQYVFDEIVVVSHDGSIGVERVASDRLIAGSLSEPWDGIDVFDVVAVGCEPMADSCSMFSSRSSR
jgi:hypothetical protein